MLRTLIVDDEQHCTDRLTKLLAKHTDVLTIVGFCDTIHAAKNAIENLQPDIVFLDIQLHERTSFELLFELPKINFEIVFTTAYDNYAVQAFRFSAIDYLLKPIDEDELAETVQKIVEKSNQKETSKKLEVLFHNFEHKVMGMKKLAIPTLEGLTLVKVDDIIRCQSDGNYTHIFMVSNNKIIATRTLKYFEELLDGPQFFRTHKSHYINIDYVEKYIKGKGGYVEMTDGGFIEIAVRRKDEFLKRLTK